MGAGHFTPGQTSASIVKTVTFGANYKSGPRLIMEVDHWERIPGYIPGNTSTTDLGLYYLKEPIPNFKAVSFGDVPMGSVPVQVDFGNCGDTFTGEIPSLGDKLAGRAIVSELFRPASSYPANKYMLLNFDGTNSTEPTQGLQFSSGAAWYYNGDIVAITIAGPNNTLDSYTTALKINTAEIQAYLQPKIQASWDALPAEYYEPPALEIAKVENGMKVSWTNKASGCILEKSGDLVNWQPITSATGSSGINNFIFGSNSFTFTENVPKQFFRLLAP
jgi:hypothetical protein